MAAHCMDEIFAICPDTKIQFLIQREDLKMIMVAWISFWRVRSFIADIPGSRVRTLPQSHGIFQAVQAFQSFA